MNPNDALAQQQAIFNQVVQFVHLMQYGFLAFFLVGFIINAVVIYLFYARLRDIGVELRKFRIAYAIAHTPESHPLTRHDQSSESVWPAPPKPLVPPAEDAKYLPKAK
jgi:hypothetical protein